MPKIETYNVRPDNFPKNIKGIRDKIIFIIHLEGMAERQSLAIEHINVMSIRQAVIDLRSAGLIKIHNGYIGLTEDGLKRYSSVINHEITMIIRPGHVLNVFKKKPEHQLGSKDICDELLLEADDKKRPQVTKALGVLKKDGFIFECNSYLNYRQYFLTDSDAGRAYIAKMEKPLKPEINPIAILFQKALPGTLTAEATKPYMY